jgi:hypothetical protein
MKRPFLIDAPGLRSDPYLVSAPIARILGDICHLAAEG